VKLTVVGVRVPVPRMGVPKFIPVLKSAAGGVKLSSLLRLRENVRDVVRFWELPHFQQRLVFHAALWNLFHAGRSEHLCNPAHNVPYVFPETQQADNFTPPAALFNTGMNFGTPF